MSLNRCRLKPISGVRFITRREAPATYHETIYLGLTTSHLVRWPNGSAVASRFVSSKGDIGAFEHGQAVTIGWPRERARLHVA
ncbi:MAG: TOBE domain-containing protein [Alphaproteobacteria bacterium]|nr:TOBE domain-containing protein [Alphaproteobacteria bacterium]